MKKHNSFFNLTAKNGVKVEDNKGKGWQNEVLIFKMTKKKILIIDDEEDFCLLLKSFFKDKGVEIYAANTLASGLRSMETYKPDILFLDNNLPDGLGWDVITHIINQYPSTELNLISAYENREFSYLRNYPVKFWEKPINFEELNRYVS